MSQIPSSTQSGSLPLRDIHSTFNKVSWLVCTYGLGLLLSVILTIIKPTAGQSFIDKFVTYPVITAVMCGIYLLFPYWLYQRQVVGGKELSGLWWLVMVVYTGILFGYLILVLFDILRQILKAIMKPQGSEQINFMFGDRN